MASCFLSNACVIYPKEPDSACLGFGASDVFGAAKYKLLPNCVAKK